MADISFERAGTGDFAEIYNILAEIDEFYGDEMAESAEERAANIRSIILSTDDLSPKIIIARAAGGPALGFAAVSVLWPAAGSSTSLYLKELYVRREFRGRGIGRSFMRYIFDLARRNRCTRVEWTTDTGNIEAQRFYESLGSSPVTQKVFYRADL